MGFVGYSGAWEGEKGDDPTGGERKRQGLVKRSVFRFRRAEGEKKRKPGFECRKSGTCGSRVVPYS